MVNTMPKLVSEGEVEEFERAGVVCLRGLFDDYWVNLLREGIERRIKNGSEADSKRKSHYSFTELFMWKVDPAFREFIIESPAANIATNVLRADYVRFYFDQIFNKEPGMPDPSPWHNDQPYYPIQGEKVCSIWLALDHVTKESSGLEYVAGSHRWEDKLEGEMIDFEQQADKYELLSWNMKPGDCLVHHGLTVHGAGGNTSKTERRRALATRWVGEDVVYRQIPGGHEQLKVAGAKTGGPLPDAQFPRIPAA